MQLSSWFLRRNTSVSCGTGHNSSSPWKDTIVSFQGLGYPYLLLLCPVSQETEHSYQHTISRKRTYTVLMTNASLLWSLGVTKWVCRMKHISEIIQLEALVIRIVYVCCVDTNECYETTNPKNISNWNILYTLEIVILK